jgi:hypothetical protein
MAAPVNATQSPYTYEEMKRRQRALGASGPGGPIDENVLSSPALEPTEVAPAETLSTPPPVIEKKKEHLSYEERSQEDELSHIAEGIKKDYPGQIPNDADPRDIIAVHRAAFAPNEDPDTYTDALRKAYAADWKKPSRNLGETVALGAHIAGALGRGLAEGVAGGITAPIEAIGAIQASERHAQERQTQAEMGTRLLQHGGKLPAGTMEEQGALASQEEAERKQANTKAAEGAAFYGTLPFGGVGASAIKGAAVPLAAKVGLGALEGAGITGGYAAIQKGLEDKFNGVPAGQIYSDIIAAGTNLKTLGLGAAVGGGIPLVGGAVKGAWVKVMGGAEARTTAAEIAQRGVIRSEMIQRLADDVTPQQIRMRFNEDLTEAAARGADSETTARVILSKITGDDPVSLPQGAVTQFASKIVRQAEAEDAAIGGTRMVSLPQEAAPAPAPEIQTGAAAVEPGMPSMATPEQRNPMIGQPMPIEGAGPGAAPVEPRPVTLGPSEPTPTEGGKLVLPGAPQPGLDVEKGQMMPEAVPVPTPEVTPPVPMGAGPVMGEAPEPHLPPALQKTPAVGDQFPPFEGPTGVRRLRTEPVSAHAKLEPPPVEKVGKTGNKIGVALSNAADAAQKRIAKRGVRLSAGLDPSDVADHAIVLASDMFTMGLKAKAAIEEHIIQKWGEAARPMMDKLISAAQKHMTRMFGQDFSKKASSKLTQLLQLHESGRHGMNWYESTASWTKEHFGEDSDMMLRFLAVTSANGQTESGAAMAMKAFGQWKSGMDFEGFRGPSMVGQLQRISKGENLGENTKIQNFYDALKGNPDAVVLDRWMIDAMGLKERGGALKENDYKLYAQIVRDLASQNGMTPRQFQAAVWEGARVRKAHVTEAAVGRSLTTKSGSARPLEQLVEKNLGGMKPAEWVEQHKLNLTKMDNLYKGLTPVRTGQRGGFTFDPATFEEDKTPGYVTTLASTVIDKKKLYPAELLKFRDQFQSVIDHEKSMSHWRGEAGQSPNHLTLGVFDMGNGKFSVDLNVTLPDKDRAVAIGFKNRQKAVGNIGPEGDYLGDVPTGYDPKKHGPQFLPPEKKTLQPAWYATQAKRVQTFLSGQGELGLSTPKVEETRPFQKAMVAKLNKILKPVPSMGSFSTGRRSGEPVWMAPDSKLYVGRSHEAVSDKVVKAAGITEKKSGYKGNNRWDNHAMLQGGFARIQMFPDKMSIQIVGKPTAEQRATIVSMAKGRDFMGVLTSHDGSSEAGPFDKPSKLFGAAEKE